MSEELISSYVDRSGIADDTKFLTDQLKTVLDLFDKVNSTKLKLNVATTLKDTTEAAKETQKAMENLTVGKDKLIKVDLELIRSLKDQIAGNKQLSDSYQELVKQSVANEIAGNKLKEQRRLLNKDFKDGLITNEQYTKALEEMKEAENALRVSNNELSRALRNMEKEAQAADGSLNQLRAQLNLALQAFDALSAEEKKSSTGEGLKQKILELTEAVTAEEEATKRFQRNVGNYPGSAKIIVDALSDVEKKIGELQVKQQGLVDFSKRNPIGFRTSGSQQDLDQTTAQLTNLTTKAQSLNTITSNPQFLNIAGKVGDTNAELKFFTKQLNQLEDAGLKNEQVYKDVQKRLAELTDQIGDTKAEIKALASDTRTFDLFAGAVNFAADTFQTFAGVLALGTDNEKEAQEVLKTLVAIQTISNGVKGIANELTTKGTAANKLYAFAQTQVSIAMDGTAAAGARLRAIMATIGFAALIVGIGLLIANFDKIKRALSGVSKQQEEFNAVMSEGAKAASNEITHLRVLEKTATDIGQAQSTRTKAAKEMQQLYPAYLKNLSEEEILNGKAAKAIDLVSAALLNRAIAQAAENKAAELGAQKLELQLKELQLTKDLEAATKAETAADRLALTNKDKYKKEEIGLEQFATKAKRQELQKQISDNKIAQEKISKDIDFFVNQAVIRQQDVNNLGGRSTRVKTVEFDDRELKKEADALKALSQLQEAYLITRISAREKAADIEKKILNRQLQVEIDNINAQIDAEKAKPTVDTNAIESLNEQKLKLQKKHNTSLRLLEEDISTDLLNIRQTFLARQQELDQQDREQFFKDQDDARNKQIAAIQKLQDEQFARDSEDKERDIRLLNEKYQKDLLATKEGSKARYKVEEKYAQDRANIEFKYADAALKTQIKYAKLILDINEKAGIDVSKQREDLHKLEMQLSDIETQRVIENNKRQERSAREKYEQLVKDANTVKEAYGHVTEFIGGLLNADIDKQKNAIQDQIDDVERKKEREIEAINATTISEQEKADKISIVNVRAAAEKEALERRQKQLELQRLRFEKAANIGRIIVNTAAAVVAALGSVPYTPANIAQAIAVGAIGAAQLAVAVAAPLPKFKHGREGGPSTWGITGDGGKSEVVSSPDLSQSFVTPDTDTLTYLPKDWKVFPDIDSFQNAAVNMVHKPLKSLPVINNNNDRMIHAMAYEIRGLKAAIMGKQETHFHWDNGQLQKAITNGIDRWRYIQNNI